jgi:nucleotide-binding universal stress UspA family protein
MRTIVVGVDGSRESLAAFRYAIGEARVHGDRVKAVTVWHVPTVAYGSAFAASAPAPHEFEEGAEAALEAAVAMTADELGDVPLLTVVREGDPAHVLVEEAEGAAQLVVGCRTLNVVGRLLHHSVSGECAHEAHCPVTVVHAA